MSVSRSDRLQSPANQSETEWHGVLPDASISQLIADGAIRLGSNGVGAKQVQPASIDLTLGRRAWRVRASFLPRPGRSVRDRLEDGLAMHELDLSDGAVLERGCVYLVELRESLKLPTGLKGAANPKSSTGRIDVFVRLVAECAGAKAAVFDQIPDAYDGPLYAEVCPRTFSIVVREGSRLNQARFKAGNATLSDQDLSALHQEHPLVNSAAEIDAGLRVSVDLSGRLHDRDNGSDARPIGWRARRHTGLIDVDLPNAYRAEDYFDPIFAQTNGMLILDPDEFYILASKEALAVPPAFAAEMAAISPGLGEFRVHYAGFFDPGFGWSENVDLNGSRAVLEVRSHDAPFVLEDGQPVARLTYEAMNARPNRLYGEDMASNYQGQSLKLSKHFRTV
ncbi:MAG: 2'-deoxycytidine 5'-triphosphate deaminase [Pseudomonadota bacterium]